MGLAPTLAVAFEAVSVPTLLVLSPTAAGLIAMQMTTRRASFVVSMCAALVQLALLIIGGRLVAGQSLDHFVGLQHRSWLPAWNISFDVQLDAPALWLIALTTLVTTCVSTYAWWSERERPAVFQGLLWLTAGALCGLFVARDLVLFYVFFELMLVPLLLLVGGWGGEQRIRAAMTMFIYTLLGSLPMLVAVLKVGIDANTFLLPKIASQTAAGTLVLPGWTLACFLLAFAIKSPLFPFQGWMPLTYREAPIEATAMLSALVSKAAMFGMLAVVLPLYPSQLDGSTGRLLTWAVLGSLLYASIAAFRQPDARGVVAYSSMAQMGLIFLGLSVFRGDGGGEALAGSYMQAVNHGLISAAMFLICGVVERRAGSGELSRLGGLAKGRPVLATIVLTTSMCALAVPGSNAFAGELLILAGAFRGPWAHAWLWAAIGSIAIVLAAMYVLRLLSALMHDPEHDTAEHSAEARERFGGDLRLELAFLLPLVASMLVLSAWPNMLRSGMNERPVNMVAASAEGAR